MPYFYWCLKWVFLYQNLTWGHFVFTPGSSPRCCAFVKSLTHEGESACYLAAKHGHSAVVQLLLKAKADMNQLTNDSSCPLYAGIPVHIVLCDRIWFSLIHIYLPATVSLTAVNGGHKEIVELLVRNGAEVNRTHTASCWTCLHQAVYGVITEFATHSLSAEKHTAYVYIYFFFRVTVKLCESWWACATWRL